jgi:putative ABC transport system permease protein
MMRIKLAFKLFLREFRNGDLTLLFLSLVIATGSLSCVGFLIQRIDSSMNSHAEQINGAQLIIKSPREIPQQWLEKAKNLQLNQAQMWIFPSMLVSNDEFRLAQIKAVSGNFPLQGELLMRPDLSAAAQSQKAPPAGEIWLDNRLLNFFRINLSQQTTNKAIELGEAQFNVTGVIERMPGQASSIFSIAPVAVVNLADLPRTDTIQPGSRVRYLYFFTGSDENLQAYKQFIEPMLQAGQTLRTGVDNLRAVNANLKKASDFLALSAILTVLLSAIAITINSYRYGRKQFKNSAIMLCLGCSEKSLLAIELIKLVTLAIAGSVLGILLGYLVYAGLLAAMSELLPDTEAVFYGLPAWVALSSGFLLLLSVSMANLVQLKKLSPMALIRKDMPVANINTNLLYLLAITGLLVISFWYTDNFKITAVFYLVILLTAGVLYFVARFLLNGIIRLGRQYQWINRLSLMNLERHKSAILLQITSFSLIFSLLIVILLVRTELLDKWQQQFPDKTPNHFMINVQSYETDSMKQFFSTQDIHTEGLYPMVRGRITQLNQQPIRTMIPKSAYSHNALNRELNLSFSQTLFDNSSTEPRLSIEKELAKALGISIGDSLGFQIGSQTIEARVSEIRKVHWDSFQPNFYIIFSPGLIEQYPMTWIASFYLAKEDKGKLAQLMELFPGVTIIEVDEILKEIQFIIEKVSHAIEIIFIFIMAAGALILSSSLSATLAARMYENAVIRTLGASSKQLRRCLLVELLVVALLSALIAIGIAEISTLILYKYIFDISYSLHLFIWSSVLLVAMLLIGGLGLLTVNRIFTQSTQLSLNQYSND